MSTLKYEIVNLQEVLSDFLTTENVLLDYYTKRLTAPGENYGSLMVSLQMKLYNKQSKTEETLKAIAKLYPTNKWIREVFTTHITFRNEFFFYSRILKEFLQLESKGKMNNIHPKYFGGRLSLNPKVEVADEGSVLILENLEEYTSPHKSIGFNFETSVLIVKAIATFNAKTIVMRQINPEAFKRIVSCVTHIDLMFELSDEVYKETWSVIEGILRKNKNGGNMVEIFKDYMRIEKKIVDLQDPYVSLTHNDLWVNNVMVKFVRDKPVDVKIIDMQLITFGSVLNDVVYYLFTSVQKDVFANNLKELIDIYYQEFLGILDEFNCDTSSYVREKFEEELAKSARNQMFRIIFMYKYLYTKNETDLSDIKPEDMIEMQMSDAFYEKFWLLVEKYKEFDWLNASSEK